MNTLINAQVLEGLFDRIYIINLPDRTDRKREISEQLHKVGLSLDSPLVHLFPAVRPMDSGAFPSVGAHGCFMSHLKIIELALLEEFSSILILEDDVDWTSIAIEARGNGSLSLLSTRWDFLHGGLGHDAFTKNRSFSLKKLQPEEEVRLTHFIGLRGAALPAVYRYLSDMLDRPAGSPQGGPMHVDGAYSWFRRDNNHIESYICVPSIAMQRPSLSDISPPVGIKSLPLVRDMLELLRARRKKNRNKA